MKLKRSLKLVLGPIIIVTTIAVFAHYLSEHTNLLHQLAHTPLTTVIAILLLDGVAFIALALLLSGTLRLYNKELAAHDRLLLNAYSALINFFGPGQSGPAIRAAYLKKQVGMRLKDYTFATLIYYGFYAVLSGFLMMAGSRPWWQTVIVVGVIAIVSWLVVRRVMKRRTAAGDTNKMNPVGVGKIAAATVLQLATLVAMYSLELHAVTKHVGFGQVMAYTGVANFALFVSLTPGAIGIRESFLVFSERLHHISSSAIVGANLIDRGVYILFLGILFLVVLGLHAKRRLHLRTPE